MIEFKTDPRYDLCTIEGRLELEVYLQWIKDTSLDDTEYAFVNYVMGRAQIKDARHLFAIWEHQIWAEIDKSMRSQVRRFFMNPSVELSFKMASYAGWFDFIPSVYQLQKTVPLPPPIYGPTFVKVGGSELPLEFRLIVTSLIPVLNNSL